MCTNTNFVVFHEKQKDGSSHFEWQGSVRESKV